MKAYIAITAALVLLFSGAVSAAEEDAEKKAPPSFRPGASVELEITIKAPKRWSLNYRMPINYTFDPEYLKDAPFTASAESTSITLEQYSPYSTVTIPIKLKNGLEDGRMMIELPVVFSICNEVTENCAFAQETITIPVEVKSSADEGEENQALKSGKLEHSHLLSVP